jgi:hypothetical protein
MDRHSPATADRHSPRIADPWGEEYYTLAVIGKAGLGTPHMDGNTRLCTATSVAALKASFGTDGQPGSYADVDHCDALALYGHNVAATQTVLWMRMLDRLHGPDRPALLCVDPRTTPVAREADVHTTPPCCRSAVAAPVPTRSASIRGARRRVEAGSHRFHEEVPDGQRPRSQREGRQAVRGPAQKGHEQGARGAHRELARRLQTRRQSVRVGQETQHHETGRHEGPEGRRRPQGRQEVELIGRHRRRRWDAPSEGTRSLASTARSVNVESPALQGFLS